MVGEMIPHATQIGNLSGMREPEMYGCVDERLHHEET